MIKDTARDRRIRFTPIADQEFRRLAEQAASFAVGLETVGHSGPVSFYLDARIFTEVHEDPAHPSYDREPLDRQRETTGGFAHSSYSRFRSNLSYDLVWGRFTVARDAAHWGPGLFHNPTFNQGSVPFNHLTFTTHLGPLTVQSLYGRLTLDRNWENDEVGEHRSLYAHRYEWRLARNWVIGFSEQLILHKVEAPFAFVPVVPLYIAKSGENEKLNNGNISGDITARVGHLGAVYAEFMLDDIQSPATLFDDHWGNKWAFLVGTHWTRAFGGTLGGVAAEYARVEPWVYTHKVPGGSQTAHYDYPLGNQLGPNSQAMTLKAYWREEGSWYVSTRLDLSWKGTDRGSSLLDTLVGNTTKVFLAGVDEPEVRFEPYAWARWKWVGFFARLVLGGYTEAEAGFNFRY